MSLRPSHYARANNDESFDKIQELRDLLPDEVVASLLGLKVVALNWRNQPIPVVRLTYLIHRLTFDPARPLTVLELLCLGKFGTAPEAPTQQIPIPQPDSTTHNSMPDAV